MDRLSEQIRALRSRPPEGPFPPVVPGRELATSQPAPKFHAATAEEVQFRGAMAAIDTANYTRRATRQNNTIIALLAVIAVFTVVTAFSTGFLAYVLYSALQALQDAANEINTTSL